jgi:hypothetical protein
MPLEGPRFVLVSRGPMLAGGLCFGTSNDRCPDVGFQRDMDVNHPELVAVAAGGAGDPLPLGEVPVLFSLKFQLARFLPQNMKGSSRATGTSSRAAPGEDSSAEAMAVACSKEMSPCCRAELSSSESPNTLPVATMALALPTEVPITRASSELSSSLRASVATPNAASLSARVDRE